MPMQTATKTQSLFTLRQQNQNCFYIGGNSNTPNIKLPPSSTFSALPTFNQDACFFTPSFILNTDENYYRLNRQFQNQKFSDKIQQAKNELSVEIEYHVNPLNKFCQLCRSNFDFYDQHIKDKTHIKTMLKSLGNKYLHDLCQSFNLKHKNIKKLQHKNPKQSDPKSENKSTRKKRGPNNLEQTKSKYSTPPTILS